MANKPRIAFCFSGQARTLDQTYLFFQKNLFDAAIEQGFDYDIFCAVEDDEDIEKVNLLNPTKVEKIKSSDVEKIIENKYGDFINSAFKTKYKRAYQTYEGGVIRFLQQIYKVGRSIKLCGNCEKYDIIMRLRFDVIFINQFNFQKILDGLKCGNIIICDNPQRNNFLQKICYSVGQILDLFFIGDSIAMGKLGDIFENFKQCFLGHEVKPYGKPLYIISNMISQFFTYIRKQTNIPIVLLPIEIGLYTIFIPEKAYYEYFIYNEINVIKKDISLILPRKKINKSYVRLEEKTEYEI